MALVIPDIIVALVMLELYIEDYRRWFDMGRKPRYYWKDWAHVCRQFWQVFKRHELYIRTMFHACASPVNLNQQIMLYQSTRFSILPLAFRMDYHVEYGQNLCDYLKEVSPRIVSFEVKHNKVPCPSGNIAKLYFDKAHSIKITYATMEKDSFPNAPNLVVLNIAFCVFPWSLSDLVNLLNSTPGLKVFELGMMVYNTPLESRILATQAVKLRSLMFLEINLSPQKHSDLLDNLLHEESVHVLEKIKISEFPIHDSMLEPSVNRCKKLLGFTDDIMTLWLHYREISVMQGRQTLRNLRRTDAPLELYQTQKTLAAGPVGKLWYQLFQPQIKQIVFSDQDHMHYPLSDMSLVQVIAILFPFDRQSEDFKLLATVMQDYRHVEELVLLITEKCTREDVQAFWKSHPNKGDLCDTSELKYISICDSNGKGMVEICRQEQPEDIAWYPVTVYSDIMVCTITVVVWSIY
jgi:hypothetical protein